MSSESNGSSKYSSSAFLRNSVRSIFFKRLRASSMIETITAMLIIMMVFGFATIIFLHVYRTGNMSQRMEAAIKLQDVWAMTKHQKEFTDREWIDDDFSVVRKVLPYSGSERLVLIQIEVYRKETSLALRKFLINKE